jgi:hypothetical protein
MGHTNYRHLLSASHGTHKLSAPTLTTTWDTQTIGTYSHHHMGHTNYRHLLSASHGTKTRRVSRTQILNVIAGGTHNNHWAWKVDYSNQSNKALLTSQQFPKIEKEFCRSPNRVTSLRWTGCLYLHKVCGNGGKDASCGDMDYDTVKVGMWLINVSEEHTASICTVS